MNLPDKKLSVKIIACDLDDTLLTDELSISPRTVRAVQAAAAQGIYIVLASGRVDHAILPFVRVLDCAGLEAGRYIIAQNGAALYDLHARDLIYSRTVPTEVARFVYREAQARALPVQVYDATTIYTSFDNPWSQKDAELSKLQLTIVDNYEQLLSKSFPKIVIPAAVDSVRAFQLFLTDALTGRAEIFTSKPYFLEIMPPECGKGESLLWLAQKLDIPRAQTMAFGDGMNDISLLTQTAYGVAMCNGHADVQACARYVTRFDNNHDGIADFLEEFVL
ncbi:MAG: HAD family phosphatase [Treponema sp.]|nr:HAD family phosphatase [Treponema sp.]